MCQESYFGDRTGITTTPLFAKSAPPVETSLTTD